MTKAEIVNEITDRSGVDKAIVSDVIEHFFRSVKGNMATGNNLYFRGFGSFILQKRAQKIGRNITKKTSIVIDAHFIPKFKPAKLFSEKIKRSEQVKKLL